MQIILDPTHLLHAYLFSWNSHASRTMCRLIPYRIANYGKSNSSYVEPILIEEHYTMGTVCSGFMAENISPRVYALFT